jgi:hypothetical protein
MSNLWFRSAVLSVALLGGTLVYHTLGEPRGAGQPRWPASDGTYAVTGWQASAEQLEAANHQVFASRTFRDTGGKVAQLTIATNQDPKVFVAGAEVPYLGTGYSVEPTPAGLLATAPGRDVFVARRGNEQLLVVYGYGERRGFLGNGFVGWAAAVTDLVLGSPNDYYKVYLITSVEQLDPAALASFSQLASVLFPRIADWYGA